MASQQHRSLLRTWKERTTTKGICVLLVLMSR